MHVFPRNNRSSSWNAAICDEAEFKTIYKLQLQAARL